MAIRRIVGKLPPERWNAYVAEACGDDTELEQQVGHLLQVHREAEARRDYDAVIETFAPDCYLETVPLGLRSEGRAANEWLPPRRLNWQACFRARRWRRQRARSFLFSWRSSRTDEV